jgi:hypothetical protein
MDVMAIPSAKTAERNGAVEGRGLKRLEFEMALKIGDTIGLGPAERLRKAAMTVGGDLLFVLPAKDAVGTTGAVRLVENGRGRFILARISEGGFAILEEGDIDADLLGFARASLDVLERLRADRQVPDLAPAAH